MCPHFMHRDELLQLFSHPYKEVMAYMILAVSSNHVIQLLVITILKVQ